MLGALPLVRYRASALAGILRDGGRGATDGRGRHRTRSLLVAAQLALALVLLVGSGLMLRSFDQLRHVDPGFRPDDVVSVGMSLGETFSGRNPEGARFYQDVADEVATLPGVRSVGLTSRAPMGEGDSNGGSFYIEGEPREEGALPPVAMYKAVGADYLEAIGQPLLRGRTLEPSDWEDANGSVLVNEAFEKAFLGGSAIGKGIKWDEERAFARVVGVVADAHEFSLSDEPRPVAYLPMVVADWGYPGMARMYLLVRGDGRTPVPVTAIRDVVRRHGPEVPITTVRTMDEIMANSIAQTSFTMVLLGLAAAVALFLGAVGLFAVVSYVVGQRTREIGVRVALGAARADIRRMVFRQSAVVAAAGVAVGLLTAGVLTRFMGAILYDVSDHGSGDVRGGSAPPRLRPGAGHLAPGATRVARRPHRRPALGVAVADTIPVIAAVILRDGRYLVGRRPPEKRHGGLWEFPGGKVHDGEALLTAADRELEEELGMRAVAAGALLYSGSDGDSPFVIHFVEVEAEGDPAPFEHSEVGWFTLEELAELPLAPADASFLRTLGGGAQDQARPMRVSPPRNG